MVKKVPDSGNIFIIPPPTSYGGFLGHLLRSTFVRRRASSVVRKQFTHFKTSPLKPLVRF